MSTFNTHLAPVSVPGLGASTDLFVVTGQVVVTSIFGLVTTELDRSAPGGSTNGGADLVHGASVGAEYSIGVLDMAAIGANVAVGALILPGSNSIQGSGFLPNGLVLSAGTVFWRADGTYPPTGAVQWQANWYPLTPGASLVAA